MATGLGCILILLQPSLIQFSGIIVNIIIFFKKWGKKEKNRHSSRKDNELMLLFYFSFHISEVKVSLGVLSALEMFHLNENPTQLK